MTKEFTIREVKDICKTYKLKNKNENGDEICDKKCPFIDTHGDCAFSSDPDYWNIDLIKEESK